MPCNRSFFMIQKFGGTTLQPAKIQKDSSKSAEYWAKLARCCEIVDDEVPMVYNRHLHQ